MPLKKRCSTKAMQENVGKMIRECRAGKGRFKKGRRKSVKKCQAIAAAAGYSTLRKACGVRGKKRLTPKQVVAKKRRKTKKT